MSPVKPDAADVAALRGLLAKSGGRVSWQALEAAAESPEFQKFILGRHPSLTPMLASPGRRRVLQIMAASLAFGGLAAPAKAQSEGYRQIVPYVHQPTGLTPTVPLSYATATLLDGVANGVLASTIDGRPIKIEGNREHPWSQGGTDAFGQASVLDLYDPDRSQAVHHFSTVSSWETFHTTVLNRVGGLKGNGGQGFRLLTGPVTSPTLIAQIERMKKAMPAMHWHVHAPVGRDAVYAGTEQVFGRPLEPRCDFSKADVIVSLDGDFLDPGPQQVGESRAWINARRASIKNGNLLTMYAVAPSPTLTYAKADFHTPVSPQDLLQLAHALTTRQKGGEGPVGEWQNSVAAALESAHGRSIVLTGTHQSPDLHAAVHRLNGALGNIGKTIFYTDPVLARAEPFDDLVDAMRQGKAEVLVMIDTNPAFTAPADADFVNLLSQVSFKVHAGLYNNETAALSDWHVPLSHPLESWGDARSLDGTATLIQPTVETLYNGRSATEIVSMLIDAEPKASYSMLRDFWRSQISGDFEAGWRQSLMLGFVKDTAFPALTLVPAPPLTAGKAEPSKQLYSLLLRPDPSIWDGRFANNSWLQELPKVMTHTVWENVVLISAKLAAELGVSNGHTVVVSSAKRWIAGPAWIQPGQHDDTIVLQLGYGRHRVGSVGDDIGYNPYPLRTMAAKWDLPDVSIRRADTGETVAETQEVDTQLEHDFIRVQPVGGKPVGDDKAVTQPTLYLRAPTDGRAWGMVIDLDACTGCNACIISCQAENNVPVVGKDQIIRGRGMHWLRVDRYYTGTEDHPGARFMPVPCMHCETAPCELGCPVDATVHDHEGLNLMIYNRCIGTRACSAYCPYKVRHFNYMHYSVAPEAIQQQRNPGVTVRARGVMEKCTYCVQRIVAGRVAADSQHRPIIDGEVITACAAACPTKAIIFGDMEDPNSEVAVAKTDKRNYALLGDLNTRPRTTYLAAYAPTERKA